jgi:membrane protein implicated in regulation of membrane protease activity
VAPWLLWLIAAAVLLGIELASLDLVFVMLAGGAGAAAVAAAAGLHPVLQAVVFALAAATLLFGVRPVAKRHLQQGPAVRTGTAALEGTTALVLEPIDRHRGQVKIGGEVWTARPYDDNQTLDAGEEVQVMEIRGATALVWRQPWQH